MEGPVTSSWIVAAIYIIPAILNWWQSKRAADKSDDVHTLINSRMTELVKAEIASALAQGHAAGIAEERARPADTVMKVDVAKKE